MLKERSSSVYKGLTTCSVLLVTGHKQLNLPNVLMMKRLLYFLVLQVCELSQVFIFSLKKFESKKMLVSGMGSGNWGRAFNLMVKHPLLTSERLGFVPHFSTLPQLPTSVNLRDRNFGLNNCTSDSKSGRLNFQAPGFSPCPSLNSLLTFRE